MTRITYRLIILYFLSLKIKYDDGWHILYLGLLLWLKGLELFQRKKKNFPTWKMKIEAFIVCSSVDLMGRDLKVHGGSENSVLPWQAWVGKSQWNCSLNWVHLPNHHTWHLVLIFQPVPVVSLQICYEELTEHETMQTECVIVSSIAMIKVHNKTSLGKEGIISHLLIVQVWR